MDGKRGQGGVVLNLGRICTALPLPESWVNQEPALAQLSPGRTGTRFAGHESTREHLVGGEDLGHLRRGGCAEASAEEPGMEGQV